MISKMQKIWLWIFGAMVIVPEALFFTTPIMIQALNGKSFSELSSWLFNYQNFFRHLNYLLVVIAIEWVGVLGLLITSFKIGKGISWILSAKVLLFIIILWLTLIFIYIYGFRNLGF